MGLTAGIAMTAVGAGYGAAGSYRAGGAQKNIADFNATATERVSGFNADIMERESETNANILDYNARVLELQMEDAILRGRERETVFRRQVKGDIGAQRAAYAAQGIEVDSGSALDVQADTAYQGEVDALTIRSNAAREAWGFKVESESTRATAKAVRESGKLRADSERVTGKVNAQSIRLGGELAKREGSNRAFSTILTSSGTMLTALGMSKKS